MGIEFGKVSRGAGVLWQALRLTDEAADGELSVRVQTQQGSPLPFALLAGEEENDWLLALPLLSVTMTITACASGEEGTAESEATRQLSPLTTRMRAAVSLERQPLAAAADAPLGGTWRLEVDRLVRTPDGSDICQGRATCSGVDAASLAGAVRVSLLDGRGEPVSKAEWVCLGDETAPDARHTGLVTRQVDFSVRLPGSVASLVVWVQPVDAPGAGEGFLCLDAREMARLREAWRAQATPAYEDEAYDTWYQAHRATTQELALQRAAQQPGAPLVSVVVAVRKATPERLREMAHAVLSQTYEQLELVLVCSGSMDRRLASAVRSLELADARVRTVPLAADFGSAAAASEGIDAALGEYVCLLLEEDLLAPDALYEVACVIAADPEVDLVYTDEDRIEGRRHVCPLLKRSWDPVLLRSVNYVGGLMVARKSLFDGLETMGPALDGAEGYRLALHAGNLARKVRHVPRVLYHARMRQGASAGVSGAAAPLAALRAQLAEEDAPCVARASSRLPMGYEVSCEVQGEPLVSIVVPNRDGLQALERCVASILSLTAYSHYEIVVVEHGSVLPETFECYRRLEEDPRVRCVFVQGEGSQDHARVLNFGASRAQGSHLVFLSPDTEVTEAGWLGQLLSLCQREGVGAVAPRLLLPDGTVDSCGEVLTPQGLVSVGRLRDRADGGPQGEALVPHAMTAASDSCLMVDLEAFRKVGGMAKAFPGRYGDADLCLRLWGRGQRVVLDPRVSLVMHRIPTRADDKTVADVQAFGRLWQDWPFGADVVDPTSNANLDQASGYGCLG